MVLRLPRADRSARTWWLTAPDDDTLRRPELEVEPATQARLHNLDPDLLKPGRIEGLWPEERPSLTLGSLRTFFDGTQAPGFAEPEKLDEAVCQAVKRGLLMAVEEGTSLYREDLPEGDLSDSLLLVPPPAKVGGVSLTGQTLPAAWQGEQTTLRAIIDALASQHEFPLPWTVIHAAVDEALNMKLFEVAQGTWPCSPAATDNLIFRPVEKIEVTAQMIASAIEYTGSQTPTLAAIKEAIENRFFGGRSVPDESFFRTAQGMTQDGVLSTVDPWNDQTPGSIRVRRPDAVLFGETHLDELGLQRLAESVSELFETAPELNFAFRVTMTAEGQMVDASVVERLNEILGHIQSGWKLQ
jgi:hypothetical protein